MRRLLLVSEWGVKKTERRFRLEYWEGGLDCDYMAEKHTSPRIGGGWRPTKEFYPAPTFEQGLALYEEFVWLRAIDDSEAILRGVAFCDGVEDMVKAQLKEVAHRILSNTWDFSANFPQRHLPVLHYAYLGHFRKDLPRHRVGSGCWAVQFYGFKACKCCAFEGERLCLGKAIRRTGKNNVGKEVPII